MTCHVLLEGYAGGMKVSEKEAAAILRRIQKEVEMIDAAQQRRDDRIREAMEAGIPRQQIADSAGISRPRLYQITGDSK